MTVEWRKPTESELELEYYLEVELKGNKGRFGKSCISLQDFKEAAQNAYVQPMSEYRDSKVDYRSHCYDRESLTSLLKSYRSWPEFRNEETVERLYSGIINGEVIPMPIIMMDKEKDRMIILGGNTRADVAMQIWKTYDALIIEY